MNFRDVGIVAGGILMAMSPVVHAELVYENDPQAVTQESQRMDDRDSMRQALGASEKAQATVQARPKVQAQTQTVQVTPTVVTPAVVAAPAPVSAVEVQPAVVVNTATEVQNLSKSELLRRERVRAELKNEDVLQERLEELRLRDERRRTEQLIGGGNLTTVVPTGSSAVLPVTEEVVTPPVTEQRPVLTPVAQVISTSGPTSAPVAVAAAPVVAQQDQISTSQAVAVSSPDPVEKTLVFIQPRIGFASMNATNGYDVVPHFSAGIGLGLGVSDNVSFEMGYAFSEYGLAMNSANPWVTNSYYMPAYSYGYNAGAQSSFESYAFKQNVVDAGIKLHFLGPDARLRPFVAGGGAYAKSFMNYDQQILNNINQFSPGMAPDYELSQFLGYLSTGLDVRVNKSISIGATFKYFTVLSARENQGLNNAALAGMGPWGYNPATVQWVSPSEYYKEAVGGSLARSSFYNITGGVSFTF